MYPLIIYQCMTKLFAVLLCLLHSCYSSTGVLQTMAIFSIREMLESQYLIFTVAPVLYSLEAFRFPSHVPCTIGHEHAVDDSRLQGKL